MKRLLAIAFGFTLVCGAGAQVAPKAGQKTDGALSALPPRALCPDGWIKQHIEEDFYNGWISNVEEMSRDGDWWVWPGRIEIKGGSYGKAPFYQPYIEHRGAHAAGEYQAHWLDAICRIGWIADVAEARQWADRAAKAILANIPENGYLGVVAPADQFTNVSIELSEYELWSYGEHLFAMMLYHRMTGDADAAKAAVKAADLFCDTFDPQKQGHRELYGLWWASMIYSLMDVYEYHPDERYIRMAEYMMPTFLKAMRWDMESVANAEVLGGHTAGLGIAMRAMLVLYQHNGDAQLLDLICHLEKKVEAQHMLPNGSPSGHNESLCGTGPYVHMELCDPFWWVWHWTEMLKLTGDSRYADLAEKAVFNALPGARSKDGNATAYFTCQNQLTTSKYIINNCMMHYAIRQICDCCHSNGVRLLPVFVESMLLRGKNGEVVIAGYGPLDSTVQVGGQRIGIRQQTNYPFEENVQITVTADKAVDFALHLRIPGWCNNAEISVNGKKIEDARVAGSWAKINRQWRSGDRIDLQLPMAVRVEKHRFNTDIRPYVKSEDRDGVWAEAITVERGPLLYSLPVPAAAHNAVRIMGKDRGGFEELAAVDGPWNYALMLDLDQPQEAFEVVYIKVPQRSHAWEYPSVKLRVSARRVPDWTCTQDELVGIIPPEDIQVWPPDVQRRWNERRWVAPDLPPQGFRTADEVETVELVPYGFTLLRMTYLPWVQK